MGLRAKTHGYRAAAFLTYLEFAHALLTISTDNIKRYKADSNKNANTKQY